MKRGLFIWLCLAALFSETASQSQPTSYYIDAKSLYGFIIPQHDFIDYLIQKHVTAWEMDISKTGIQNQYWDSIFHFPRIGIGYHYLDFGNKEMLGTANSLFAFCNMPFIHTSNDRFFLSWQIGLGIAYLNKVFDMNTNYDDLAISAHWNAHINLGINSTFKITDRIELTLGIRGMHYSNGKLKSPNYGLNVMTANVGLSYRFTGKQKKINPTVPAPLKKYNTEIIYSAGMTTISAYEKGNFFISSLCADLIKPVTNKHSFGAGFDVFYNHSLPEELMIGGANHVTSIDNFYSGIHLMYEITYYRIIMTIQIGSYLYSRYYGLFTPYDRVGLKYKITPHLIGNLTLKTHWAVAEYIEWGIGYKW